MATSLHKTGSAGTASRRRHRRRALLNLYKVLRGCEDCGTQELRRLTFDHRNRSQKHHLLRGGKKRKRNLIDLSEKELIAEIGKCDVVCRKCHDARERSRDVKIQIHHYERWLAASCHAMFLPGADEAFSWREFPTESFYATQKIGLTRS